MIPQTTSLAVAIFAAFVALVLGISFYLGRKAKSAGGYFAAHGEIHWFVNGVAFAGDYLSAASFLGICGMIAFYGYDGFLYSIGYLAGWVVALFVVAEPLKRLGKFTFADALDAKFQSRGIRAAAGMSALVVSLIYLIPQMVGAGALIKPLLGFDHATGVLIVGVTVILIVVTAGMVSTTWVQFIKGGLLVILCTGLVGLILNRGLSTAEKGVGLVTHSPTLPSDELLPASADWIGKPYVRSVDPATKVVTVWRSLGPTVDELGRCQTMKKQDGRLFVNGHPQEKGVNDFTPVGQVYSLPGDKTGPVGPVGYLRAFGKSQLTVWRKDKLKDDDGADITIFYPTILSGSELLTAGGSPTFKDLKSKKLTDQLNFISLMLALFCGTASLPHILIRYYTVKDAHAARLSTVVGITTIGAFYILTLFLGLGAMTCGALDVTDNNMAAPLLARTFGELPFAVISAVAFTTVLGTVSGLIMAASGAVAHDLLSKGLGWDLNDTAKVRVGKISAVFVGIVGMALGVLFKDFNVTFLVGWAFNVAASANLPALLMLLFWKRTTKEGVMAGIFVGTVSSLAWILLSAQAFKEIYNLPADRAWVPFSQPALVTIPLGFIALIIVSLMTKKSATESASL